MNDTVYKLPNGKLYQPAESIRQSMIEAGKAFKKGRKSLTTLVAGFVMVEPEAIVHKNQEWVNDRRSVVIPATGGRVMRNRAKLSEWELEFDLKCLDDEVLSKGDLHDVLEYAGKYLGIGDYRPQTKGMFGKFIVTQFKEA